MPTIHPLALACTAVLGFLLFGLGLVVSLTRGKTQVLIGVTDDPDHILNRIVRVHGNTAEYAPFLALLFLLCGARQPGALVLGLIVAATAGRLIFVAGLLSARTLRRPSVLRFVGSALTYGCGMALSVIAVTGA